MNARAAVLLALLSSVGFAQTSLVSAALEGAVSDSSGGRVPEASIRIRETGTHQVRIATASREGIYRFSELPVGTWEIEVNQPGFARYKHAGVTLQLGATAHLDIVLQPPGVTTQVTVTAQPPAIDPAQTSVTTAVDTERIEELPVESRNYLNFALLAPGVAASAHQFGDSGFTFGGLRSRSNNISIDGLDNNDEYAGSSRTELSLETVQEFQVVNAGLSAETGGASGGSINVITRIGANDLHGDAFLFAQNGALNARNPFEAERQPPNLHRYRTGLALGGPIVRDRTFYYAGFEQEHSRSLEDAFIPTPIVQAINRTLASGLYPDVATRRLSDDPFPASRAETEASMKVNHQLTPGNSLMLRYAYTNNRESGDAFHTEGWTDPSARGSSFTEDNALVGSLTSVFSPTTVGDFRFQFADRRAVLRTNTAIGPGVDIAGVAVFGRPYDGNGKRTETHDQAAYTWSRASGRHLLKAGATFHRVHLDAAMQDGFGGLYQFGTLADFAAGRADIFRQTTGALATDFAVQNFGGFVQDHWSFAHGLTLDLGTRYDIEHLPGIFHQDANNISPRAGLAWQAAPTWVVRAGYGIFYDRYILAALNRVLEGARDLLPYTADSRLATPYSQQASFAVEHAIARDLTASASYLHVRGVKLPRTRNIGAAFQLEDSASSTYDGVSFTVNRRLADEFEFSASYTLSKTYDDASDFNEQPQNPNDLRSDWSVSRQHQQQRLVFNALWELPIGDEEPGKPAPTDPLSKIFGHIEVAPIFSVESGRPVNPLTGYSNLAYPLTARPLGLGRNSARTPMLANMDFRVLKFFPFPSVSKTAKLDVVAEAFNLFNRPNVAQVNPIYGVGPLPASMWLQPLASAGARRIQFSLDFEF
jgi:Carboxypeptidase regulatory-like domain/TonB dependent receptor-like, beta-barrel/TonB-dependent Receptor Plug Domain